MANVFMSLTPGYSSTRRFPELTTPTGCTVGCIFLPSVIHRAAAQNGTTVEGRQIPGLGDANNPRGSSLWTYDL